MRRTQVLAGALTAVLLAASPVPAAGQTASSAVAAELVRELTSHGMTAVAAKDPEQADVYAAATYLPGVQLLAVSARSTAPGYMDHLIAAGRYNEAYSSMNGGSIPEGKLFIQDMKADGLRARREDGGAFDIVYRDVTKSLLFNGDWKKQGLSEAAYREVFQDIDARYARMLSVLLAQARTGEGGHESR